MKRFITPTLLLLISGLAGGAMAAEFDPDDPMLCAIATIQECSATAGCAPVSHADVNAPKFFELDTRKKKLVAKILGESRPGAEVGNVEQKGQRLIVQAIQEAIEGIHNGLGITITVNLATGDMIAAITADDVALNMFGACTDVD